MCEIKVKLTKLIALFEYLMYIENCGAYKEICQLYKKIWENIKDKENFIDQDFLPMQNITRLFFEAIPSDDKLSEYLIYKMQEFYELKEKN